MYIWATIKFANHYMNFDVSIIAYTSAFYMQDMCKLF